MNISQILKKSHSNQIKNIKLEKNPEAKIKQIGALILDVGERSIQAVAKACGCSWRFAKKCYTIVKNNLEIISNKHLCGRKSVKEIFPNLEKDLKKIVEDYCSTDNRFKSEKQFVRLTLNQIRYELINKYSYCENTCPKKSCLAKMLNDMGYNLKKVRKSKPLKKIKETDEIFENVNNKKREAMENEKAGLISIDTKDKVLIGPYSRKGKNRIQVEACDHKLTNRCVIPFGILDIKNEQPYFYNFVNKPTSYAIGDCIEDYIKRNPNYEKLYILLDNGPDNSGVRTAFLSKLVEIVKKYKIEIELIYYPPYHSKYNPVERLWARIEKIWNGALLETEEICNNFMKNLTWKGNIAIVVVNEEKYEKGIKIAKKIMKDIERKYITRSDKLKKYSVIIIARD